MVMNPYEADPAKVPVTDLYADVPLYGRYLPQPDDFVPDPQQIGSPGCWEAILAKCDASNRLYEGMNGGRDVFALGSVVVKASHLNHKPPQRGYSQIDANEVAAIDLVRDVLATEGISVPTLHFAGKVRKTNLEIPRRALQVASINGPLTIYVGERPCHYRPVSHPGSHPKCCMALLIQ